MNKSSMVNVPFIAYEKEMEHKNKIITMLGIIVVGLIVIIIVMFSLFMSFINKYNYNNFEQDGSGQNNINTGTQGDVVNESTIKGND